MDKQETEPKPKFTITIDGYDQVVGRLAVRANLNGTLNDDDILLAIAGLLNTWRARKGQVLKDE